jgi:hypothetical protein
MAGYKAENSAYLRWAITSLPTLQLFGKSFSQNLYFGGNSQSTQHSIAPNCIANMPVPEINLNPFKDRIISWFYDDVSSKEIAERLANDHSIVYTDCTIERRLKI